MMPHSGTAAAAAGGQRWCSAASLALNRVGITRRPPTIVSAVVESPRGTSSVPDSSSQVHSESVAVNVKIQHPCNWGEHLRVVGSDPSLGSWQPHEAPLLQWSEGHVWVASLQLPPGTYEFKVVVFHEKSGRAGWEQGGNKVLEVPAEPGVLHVDCQWGVTELTTSFTADVAAEAHASNGHSPVKQAAGLADPAAVAPGQERHEASKAAKPAARSSQAKAAAAPAAVGLDTASGYLAEPNLPARHNANTAAGVAARDGADTAAATVLGTAAAGTSGPDAAPAADAAADDVHPLVQQLWEASMGRSTPQPVEQLPEELPGSWPSGADEQDGVAVDDEAAHPGPATAAAGGTLAGGRAARGRGRGADAGSNSPIEQGPADAAGMAPMENAKPKGGRRRASKDVRSSTDSTDDDDGSSSGGGGSGSSSIRSRARAGSGGSSTSPSGDTGSREGSVKVRRARKPRSPDPGPAVAAATGLDATPPVIMAATIASLSAADDPFYDDPLWATPGTPASNDSATSSLSGTSSSMPALGPAVSLSPQAMEAVSAQAAAMLKSMEEVAAALRSVESATAALEAVEDPGAAAAQPLQVRAAQSQPAAGGQVAGQPWQGAVHTAESPLPRFEAGGVAVAHAKSEAGRAGEEPGQVSSQDRSRMPKWMVKVLKGGTVADARVRMAQFGKAFFKSPVMEAIRATNKEGVEERRRVLGERVLRRPAPAEIRRTLSAALTSVMQADDTDNGAMRAVRALAWQPMPAGSLNPPVYAPSSSHAYHRNGGSGSHSSYATHLTPQVAGHSQPSYTSHAPGYQSPSPNPNLVRSHPVDYTDDNEGGFGPLDAPGAQPHAPRSTAFSSDAPINTTPAGDARTLHAGQRTRHGAAAAAPAAAATAATAAAAAAPAAHDDTLAVLSRLLAEEGMEPRPGEVEPEVLLVAKPAAAQRAAKASGPDDRTFGGFTPEPPPDPFETALGVARVGGFGLLGLAAAAMVVQSGGEGVFQGEEEYRSTPANPEDKNNIATWQSRGRRRGRRGSGWWRRKWPRSCGAGAGRGAGPQARGVASRSRMIT